MSQHSYCADLRSIIPARNEALPMLRKLYRAWRFYIGLNYPWNLAWHKASCEKAPEKALNDAILAYTKRHR